MKIKSTQALRNWIVKDKRALKDLSQSNYDPDFLGCRDRQHNKFGFFNVYHGDKEIVKDFLSTILKIAEDGQAIYEFIQNAADCGSDFFYIAYNERFFIAMNNGQPFSKRDINSILNVSQSSKFDCEKIGRFGIGFKLVHRLVGKNEGLKELTDDYKGPILFSWSQPEHFQELMQCQSVRDIELDSNLDSSAPWLFKIIITNFPTSPNETVKDLSYQDNTLFTSDEFQELIDFLKNSKIKNYLERLHKGSLFFLRLGEEKDRVLDDHHQEFSHGVEYSLNTLKTLKTVVVQDNKPIDKIELKKIEFTISKESEVFKKIEPEYEQCDIKILFGYLPYQESAKIQRNSNFYKYFPMGDEDHKLRFIIHSDGFKINASRRELQADKTNEGIFTWFVENLLNKLNEYQQNSLTDFLDVYVSILLSESPKQSKPLLHTFLYQPLLNYIQDNVPTQEGHFLTARQVVIKQTNLPVKPSDWGINDIEWFKWTERDSKIIQEIIKAAKNSNRLNLNAYKIDDLIVQGKIDLINTWISQANSQQYSLFLKELDQVISRSRNLRNANRKLNSIKFVKFVGDEFYSIDEIAEYHNVLIWHSKFNRKIKQILEQKLQFFFSTTDFSEYNHLLSYFDEQLSNQFKDTSLFEYITRNVQDPQYNQFLEASEKQELFNFLANLEGIGDAKLKQIVLFKDSNHHLKPLEELIGQNLLNLPSWLKQFQIARNEYFPKLDKYLLNRQDVYEKVIFPHWDNIIQSVETTQQAVQLYQQTQAYFETSPTQSSLTKKSYIYTREGFKPHDAIFYSDNLNKTQNNYSTLEEALEAVTKRWLPQKNILQFLSQDPFKTLPQKLEEHIAENSAQLSKSAVDSLIQFTNSNGESLLASFSIGKANSSGLYQLTDNKRSRIIQYFSEQDEVNHYIENHLHNDLRLLPEEFYDSLKKGSNLIQGTILYQKLLEDYFSDEFLEELCLLLTHIDSPDLVKTFFAKIPSVLIRQEEISVSQNSHASYQYNILALACQHIKNEDIVNLLRNKIYVVNREGQRYLAKEIAVNNEVKFSIDNQTYELKLSDILPSTQKNSQILDEVIQSLDIPKNNLKKLFGIGQSKDKNKIYEELKENYSTLQNASQLAFVLLYAKQNKEIEKHKEIEKLEGFSVYVQ